MGIKKEKKKKKKRGARDKYKGGRAEFKIRTLVVAQDIGGS
jgi:hypothetical protein